MDNKEFNEKLRDLFIRMKPHHEEYLEIMKKANSKNHITKETREVIADSAKPFLEGDALYNGL